MPILLARNWWSLVIRGLVAVVFGALAIGWPGITVAILVLLFGAYAAIDGIISLAGFFRAARSHERWGALLIEGIAGILVGFAAFLIPAVTALVLIYLIAAWAIVTGVFEIAAAIRLRKHVAGEWLLVLAGVLSIILGIVFFAAPLAGALAIALWIGVYSIVFGTVLIALGVRLRNWQHSPHPGWNPEPARS